MNFDHFWATYPRKVAKKDALKAWKRINPDEQLAGEIVEAVQKYKRTEQWTKDGGLYVPYPATFLNGERWTDDIPVEVERPKAVPVQAWWTTEQGTIAYGTSKGLPPRPGEGMSEYRERLRRVA